jgi:nucleoside-diphosphate-sugar epimerase
VHVVVTGAAGFLGRALTGALLADGETVTALDRRLYVGLASDGLDVITADLLDRDDGIRQALASADTVFHLAGCPGVRDRGAAVAWARHRDNVLATARVLALVPRRTPLVVTSSSSVYGGAPGAPGRPSVEDDPVRPLGGYARSKVAVEELCARRAAAGGNVVVARPFTVAGEGQRPDMALASWLAAARTDRPLRVLGSLDRTRDVTDVRDVVRVLRDLAAGGTPGTVNVGTGVGRPLRDLVAAVGAALDIDVRTVIVPAERVEPADTLADTRRLRALLGYVPRTDLLDLVASQAAASQAAAPPRQPVLVT